MSATLEDLRRIAEVEFGDLITDSQFIEEKLRLFLADTSHVDVWLSRKLENRFGFHWERQHLDGTLYRHDNFPDPNWKRVSTYPRHFHNGAQDKIEELPFSEDIVDGYRDFLRFVVSKQPTKSD